MTTSTGYRILAKRLLNAATDLMMAGDIPGMLPILREVAELKNAAYAAELRERRRAEWCRE
jgi:hypothetical protein